ncbi:MAG: ABC transporter substrate-binding protein, partial [Chloroflexota bacterium]|nr:ABC transporter substrate-binding protein [Chloroflexota bacterium]
GQGGIVNVAQTGGDPGIGIPILVGGTDNYTFWWAFSRLVTYDDRGEPIPDLADSWTYDPAGTGLTLKLNPNAKWHDGQPVTSADVLFTFDKIKDPATKSNRASDLQVGGQWVTWAAPDPQTVVLTTPEPFAPFLFALSQIAIIPKHLLEGSADLSTDPFNRQPIGSGPFRVVEWSQDEFVRYERFPEYHRGPAAADGLNEVFFEDAQPALAAMEAGEVDVVFTPPESQPPYEDNPDFVLHRYVYFTPISLSFNFKHPILQDPVIRQAIRFAIDKDGLAEILTKGRNTRADNQYAAGGPLDRYNDPALPPDVFDLAQANALLDGAGWVRGDDGVRAKDGQRLSFPMLTYSGFEEYRNGLEVLQSMLGEVGIETAPEVIDYDALSQRWADPEDDPQTRPLTLEEYPHPYEQDPDVHDELHSRSIPPAASNYNYVADAEIDRLLDEGRRTTDDEARIGIYRQLDARRREVIPSIPLYLATDAWVFSRAVQGVPAETPSSRWFLRCCANMMFKGE